MRFPPPTWPSTPSTWKAGLCSGNRWFEDAPRPAFQVEGVECQVGGGDRKSTRLNSSHSQISYAVFCLKKKKWYDQILQDYLVILLRLEHPSPNLCRAESPLH